MLRYNLSISQQRSSAVLPSQVHPSYPYGNPTSLKHPAARPRKPTDLTSRALFSDLSYAGGGANGALRWRDLALDKLLHVDQEKEEASRAAFARKMASGSGHNNNPAAGLPQVQPTQPGQQESDEEDDEEDDEVESGSADEDADEDEDEDVENSGNIELSFEEN